MKIVNVTRVSGEITPYVRHGLRFCTLDLTSDVMTKAITVSI